ncbi:condensation domain-containing protein, partial [Bacillus mycoides]
MNCLSKDNVQDILELSLVQKAVLPNGSLTQVAYELQGNFDSDRLQQAWEETVATHQALRSVFRTLKNRTVQVLLKQRPIPIEWLDLYGMEEEEQQTKFQSVANSHREPIEIETGPLIRLAVCRFNEERTVILWTHHALCMDDHSRDRIFNEWMDRTQKIMQAGLNYKSYKEYLAWEAGQDGMPAKKYWIDQLTGYEPIPMLQLMHSQTEGKGNAHSCSTLLSEELSKRLEQIAVQHHVSEEALLLVTWLLLLQVYSGEKSVSCGATVSGRPMNWEEDIIGPFAHNLLINTTLTTNQRLGEVFATVQKQWEQLQEISHVPSEIARTYVDITEDNSLFDSSVTVRRSVNNRYCNPYLLYRSGKEQIEAIVTIGSRWKIELFQPNSSSLPALKRLLEHFVTLLESISNQSDAQLREL